MAPTNLHVELDVTLGHAHFRENYLCSRSAFPYKAAHQIWSLYLK